LLGNSAPPRTDEDTHYPSSVDHRTDEETDEGGFLDTHYPRQVDKDTRIRTPTIRLLAFRADAAEFASRIFDCRAHGRHTPRDAPDRGARRV
jgi:hypothetical protein